MLGLGAEAGRADEDIDVGAEFRAEGFRGDEVVGEGHLREVEETLEGSRAAEAAGIAEVDLGLVHGRWELED